MSNPSIQESGTQYSETWLDIVEPLSVPAHPWQLPEKLGSAMHTCGRPILCYLRSCHAQVQMKACVFNHVRPVSL